MVGKYYIVFEGRKLGIYNTWNETKVQVLGYRGAQNKMYKDLRDAKNAFVQYWTINDTELHVEMTQQFFNDILPKMDNYATHSYYYRGLIFGFFIGVFTTLLILYIGKKFVCLTKQYAFKFEDVWMICMDRCMNIMQYEYELILLVI